MELILHGEQELRSRNITESWKGLEATERQMGTVCKVAVCCAHDLEKKKYPEEIVILTSNCLYISNFINQVGVQVA